VRIFGQNRGMDEIAINTFLNEAKGKASDLLTQEHVGTDAKNNIKDLIQICDSYRGLIDQLHNSSADSRLAKRKLEQSRVEIRAAEKQAEEFKKMILGIVPDLKQLSAEANAIIKRHPSDEDTVSARQILNSAQNLAKIVVEVSKLDNNAKKDT